MVGTKKRPKRKLPVARFKGKVLGRPASITFKPLTVITGRSPATSDDGAGALRTQLVDTIYHMRRVRPTRWCDPFPEASTDSPIIVYEKDFCGLDPWQIRRRVDRILDTSRRRQIILSTADPFLLDMFDIENVFVFDDWHADWALKLHDVARYRGVVAPGAMFLQGYFGGSDLGDPRKVEADPPARAKDPPSKESMEDWVTEVPSKHDWVKSKGGVWACRRCLRVRQANGSTEARPCKTAKIALR